MPVVKAQLTSRALSSAEVDTLIRIEDRAGVE